MLILSKFDMTNLGKVWRIWISKQLILSSNFHNLILLDNYTWTNAMHLGFITDDQSINQSTKNARNIHGSKNKLMSAFLPPAAVVAGK